MSRTAKRHNDHGHDRDSAGEQSFEDEIRAILNPSVELRNGWVLIIKRLDARSDEPGTSTFDLSAYWLPPNAVFPKPQRLVEQPQLAACVVLAINEYWNRAKADKSRHRRCASLLATLVKFIEYSWLHNRYDLNQWEEFEYTELANLLAKGGWQHALNIRSRLENYCIQASSKELKQLLEADSGVRQKNINSLRFQAVLGTNVQGREPKIYMSALRSLASAKSNNQFAEADVNELLSLAKERGPSSSMLRQTFDCINYLYDLPLSVGISHYPFKASHTLAKKLGKPVGRTPNIGANEAAKLLAEAFRWIYHYGPHISALIAELCDSVIRAHGEGRLVLGHDLDDIFSSSPNRAWLDEKLPWPLKSVDMGPNEQGHLSVRSALLCLHSACFFAIAGMNARRRDEVAHRRFGIHRGFIHVSNAELRLYEAEFYIEKTYCDYLSFYVNQATLDATNLLEQIQSSFDRVDEALGRRFVRDVPQREQSLFTYRRFSRTDGVGANRCWFNFETRPGANSENFVAFALGLNADIVPTPHMFRRMYALIFYYQYSNSTLQSLSHQMQHAALGTTMIYVTDPWFIEGAKRIGEKVKGVLNRRRRAFDLHTKQVHKQLTMVSDEMLVETILEILSGAPVLGGYSRFIRFVYARLAKQVVFDEGNLQSNAKSIAVAVKGRGHFPTPMRHGQCMAGSTPSVQLAHCKDEESNSLQRELASPRTCATCAYHHSSENYLRNLREDLGRLTQASNIGVPLEREIAKRSAKNLAQIIELHERRIAMKYNEAIGIGSKIK